MIIAVCAMDAAAVTYNTKSNMLQGLTSSGFEAKWTGETLKIKKPSYIENKLQAETAALLLCQEVFLQTGNFKIEIVRGLTLGWIVGSFNCTMKNLGAHGVQLKSPW